MESNQHSALNRAKEFLGEIEQRPLDYTEGLVFDLVEQLDASEQIIMRLTLNPKWSREDMEQAGLSMDELARINCANRNS